MTARTIRRADTRGAAAAQAAGGKAVPQRQSEAALHKAVADYLRLAIAPPWMWTTFPAGGGGKVRGARLKALGLQAGWPDILVMGPHPSSGPAWLHPHVIGVELKSKTGSLSTAQRANVFRFEDIGGHFVVCRSVVAVEEALRRLMVPLRATTGLGMRRVA